MAVLWILWCLCHSLLISRPVTGVLKARLGGGYRYYRLCYNLFSVATLLPLLWYSRNGGEVVFHWSGWLAVVQWLMCAGAGLLFVAGARQYDLPTFLGFRQTASGGFNTNGVLAVVRHPWYTGALLLIWSRTSTRTEFIINCVLTGYILVGTCLEERKLGDEFAAYAAYQRRVSMLVPYKWLKWRLSRSSG
ncbi:MAG: hypothetical protein HOH74_02430 [Gemmatimonadetes bacterium]|nr:hypothetical protein [Gemmatimonadota bacterium]